MKQLLMICFVVLFSLEAFAQDEKKPSWSPPLPEKRKVLKPKVGLDKGLTQKEDIQVDAVSFDSEFTTDQDASVENSLDTESIVAPLDIDAADITISSEEIQDTIESNGSAVSSEAITEADPAQQAIIRSIATNRSGNSDYSWTLLESSPVKAPRTAQNDADTVHLYVTINSDGRVVAVSPASANGNQRLAMHASRWVQKWVFEAPKNYGINGNVSGTLEIAMDD